MLRIDIDMSGITKVAQDNAAAQLAVQQAVMDAGVFVRDTWVAAVSGTVLPGMSRGVQDEAYAKSIQMFTADSTFLEVGVAVVDYAHAEDIEHGLPAYDMKPGLLNGPKSRPTKDGRGRYNIVPFRHRVPASTSAGSTTASLRMRMPSDIYSQAKQLARSLPNPVTGKVDWGARLKIEELGGINRTSLYQHKNNRFDGMYRVGGERHSQYLTFRAVATPRTGKNGKRKGSAPNSWIHPATPANPVMQAVVDFCTPKIEQAFSDIASRLFT